MTNRLTYSHSSPSTSYYLEADQYDQNPGANTSRVQFRIFCINNGSSGGYSNSPGEHYGYAGGSLLANHTANPFLPSGVASGGTRWATGYVYPTVAHDADGNGSVVLRQYVHSTDGAVGTNDQSVTLYLTRIPQVPGVPGAPTISSTTSNSISLAWAAASRGHANITSYDITYADNAGFTSPTTVTSATLSKVVSGLAPGKRYWLKVRAINSDGAGAYSAPVNVFVGIAAKKWDGAAEVAIATAVRWDGSAEVPITTAVRWNGTAEVPLS